MKRLRSSGTVSSIDPSGSVNVLKQIEDLLRGIQGDLSQVITEYNTEVYSVISTLPQGKRDTRWNLTDDSINPRVNNLDGANVFVDTNASSVSNGGRFWYSTGSRPKTIKESLLSLYTDLTDFSDQLRTEIGSSGSRIPVAAYNTSVSSSNVVEDDVRSIVFDGSSVSAVSSGIGTIKVVSTGQNVRGAPAIIVGNSGKGDNLSDCDFLDTGNGAELSTAIASAISGQNVYIRPGTYNFNSTGGPSTRISVGDSVRILGAGLQQTTIIPLDTDPRAFVLGDGAILEDLSVYLNDDATGNLSQTTSGGVIELSGSSLCKRVQVSYGNSWSTWDPTKVLVSSSFLLPSSAAAQLSRLERCQSISTPALSGGGGPTFVGVRHSQVSGCILTVNDGVFMGGDSAIISTGKILIEGCLLIGGSNTGPSISISGTASHKSRIRGCEVQITGASAQNGIEISSDRFSVTDNWIEASSGNGGTAVKVTSGSYGAVNGNRGRSHNAGGSGWGTAVSLDASSDYSTIVGNNFYDIDTPGAGTYTNTTGTNVVAHNI